ncbi:MAG: 6-bladed beta-propeller [Verrucomicrobiota bacterium]
MKIPLPLGLCAMLFAAVSVFAQPAPQDNWTLDFSFPGASTNGRFNRPGNVAVGPGGRIVVADSGNSRIQVFDATGAFLLRFGSSAVGNSQLGDRGLAVAVAADGKIVVADRSSKQIKIFNADGSFVRAFGSEGTGTGQFGEPSGVAITATGRIVVSDALYCRIQVFEGDGTFVRMWGSGGTLDVQFRHPMGVMIDVDGNIVVADDVLPRLSVFTVDGVFVRKWVPASGVIALAPLTGGRIVALDQGRHLVVIFGPDGVVERTWGSEGSGGGQFLQPGDIAVASDGNILVCDTRNNRIQFYTENGIYLHQFGELGGPSDGFGDSIRGIEADADGRIYVTDSTSGFPTIQIFSSNGAPIDQMYLQDDKPATVKIGPTGRIYAADTFDADAGGIRVYEGSVVPSRTIGFGTPGSGNGQFGSSGAYVTTAIDANGDIYATDPGNGRVQVFGADGAFLRKFGAPGSGPGQLSQANGIALTPDGRVVVSGGANLNYFTKAGVFIEATSGGGQRLHTIGPDGIYYYFSTSISSPVTGSPSCAGVNVRTGALYSYDVTSRRVQVWRRGFRTLGTQPAALVPMPGIRAVAQRPNGYIDIDYSVNDGDSATVTTALAAFRGGSVYIRDMVPLAGASLVEGTAAKVGAGIATGAVHRVTWNPAGSGLSSGDLVFEVFAWDARPKLLDMDFITLPTTPALTISRIPFTHADFRAAWAWLLLQAEPGLTRASDGEIAGPGGAFTVSGVETRTTAAGRSWLFAKLGVREATAAEVTAARKATAANTPNQYPRSATQRMGDRPRVVNEWGFDSDGYGTDAWWVVPL